MSNGKNGGKNGDKDNSQQSDTFRKEKFNESYTPTDELDDSDPPQEDSESGE